MRPGVTGLLVRTDLRLIGRDRFLLGVAAFILAVALVVRLLLPGVTRTLAGAGFDLVPYYPLIASYVALFVGSQLAGVVYGFTLLESREDGTIRAVLASPLPLSTFLIFRTAAPVALGCVVIPAIAAIVGVALPPAAVLAPVALVAAMSGAIWALFVAALAENKVQAFAILKIAGAAGPLVLGAWFLRDPWQWLVGVIPAYWPLKAWWMALEGGAWWWPVTVGAALSSLAIAILVARFARVAAR